MATVKIPAVHTVKEGKHVAVPASLPNGGSIKQIIADGDLMQKGTVAVSITNDAVNQNYTRSVTFPTPFSSPPAVIAQSLYGIASAQTKVWATNITATGFTIVVWINLAGAGTGTLNIAETAIGGAVIDLPSEVPARMFRLPAAGITACVSVSSSVPASRPV